jgi:hypothetical protein
MLVPASGAQGQVLTRTATTAGQAGWLGWQTPQAGGGVPPLTADQIVFGGAGGAIAQSPNFTFSQDALRISMSPYAMRLWEGGIYMNSDINNVADEPTSHGALFLGMDNESADPSFFWLGAKAPLGPSIDFKNWMGLSAESLSLYGQRIRNAYYEIRTIQGQRTTDQPVTQGATVTMTFPTLGWNTDPGNLSLNTGTGVFTVTRAGFYRADTNITTINPAWPVNWTAQLVVNGAVVQTFPFVGGIERSDNSVLLSVPANGTVQLRIASSWNQTFHVRGVFTLTYQGEAP